MAINLQDVLEEICNTHFVEQKTLLFGKYKSAIPLYHSMNVYSTSHHSVSQKTGICLKELMILIEGKNICMCVLLHEYTLNFNYELKLRG